MIFPKLFRNELVKVPNGQNKIFQFFIVINIGMVISHNKTKTYEFMSENTFATTMLKNFEPS